MKKLALFIIILTLGCQNELPVKTNSQYFDVPLFTQRVIQNMVARQVDVSKRFVLNTKLEEKTVHQTDSLFWTKELEHLLKTDLNAPQYAGAIQFEGALKDSNSNLLIDRFTPKDDRVNLKKLEVFYLEDNSQIRKINLALSSSNFLSSSNLELMAWFNQYGEQLVLDSVTTTGNDKIMFQEERVYESHLARIRN